MRTVRLVQACWLSDTVHGDAGDPLALEDAEAAHVVALRLAVYADGAPAQEAPVVKAEPEPDPDDLPGHTEAVADGHPGESPLAAPKVPWTTHSKAAWIDWAVHQGADPEQAAALTKNELMSRYGERL